MRNLIRWLPLFILVWVSFARAESIPIVTLNAQGQEQLSTVSRQNYVDGLIAMMRSVESESHAALEQTACAEKDWVLNFVSLSIGLSAEVGFSPFFEVGFAPRFSLAFSRGAPYGPYPPVPNCGSVAIATDTLANYLSSRIANLSSILEGNALSPTLDETQNEAWYFDSLFLGISPEVTFTVAVASFTVVPTVGLGWLRSLPDGWAPYRPSGS